MALATEVVEFIFYGIPLIYMVGYAIYGLVRFVRAIVQYRPQKRYEPNPPTEEEAEQWRRDLIAKFGHPVKEEEPAYDHPPKGIECCRVKVV